MVEWRERGAARGRTGRIAALIIVACAAAASSACIYRGRDDALSQRFTWFSYLNGDDIRADCAAGSRERYRFVYNGIYVKQVRTYDIVPTETTGSDGREGFLLRVRVLGPSDLSNVSLDPAALIDDPLDILAPFAGARSRIGLGGRDIDSLDQSLVASGFFQPAPQGLYLNADDFFWVGVACMSGKVVFNAWRFPSARFDALRFPQLLFGWDPSGVQINPPRDLSPFEIHGQATAPDTAPRFTLTVGEQGLAGPRSLFQP